MSPIVPKRLRAGDEVRIVAPSRSLGLISQETKQTALERLQKDFGLNVTFSKHCEEIDAFVSSSISSRVHDLCEAFADKSVKAVLTVIGGYNCNQLLKHLDYELIKRNPKILCGFSDITALSNAIFQKASLITFSGPHFSTFGCKKNMSYTIEHFKSCLMESAPIALKASKTWSDDEWYLDQDNRMLIPNDGLLLINQGKAEGTIVGGNLCTFNLLHGTEYMPDLEDTILFIEDDYLVFPEVFDRDLQSLIMQPGFFGVRGIVIGRFQQQSKMPFETLVSICRNKKELDGIPIIANADFGHTLPMFTFPIGGKATLDATKENPSLTFEW